MYALTNILLNNDHAYAKNISDGILKTNIMVGHRTKYKQNTKCLTISENNVLDKW